MAKTAKKKPVKKTAVKNRSKSAKKQDKIMIQHMYKLNGFYRDPDGRILKIVVSEVYNLRCFEIINGKMTGGMIKIHPASDLAKSLVEVTG